MRAGAVQVRVGDARRPPVDDSFDRVLVDPPCSGLGTLRSRPDLRWRVTPAAIGDLAGQQTEILEAAAAAVRPGGVLVYSTCTLARGENEDMVAGFLARNPAFALDDGALAESGLEAWEHPRMAGCLLTLPHRHATDGFFVARMRRNSEMGAGR